MNHYEKRLKKILAFPIILAALLLTLPLQAAPEPAPATQLDGDTITFSAKTGIMTAQGGVKLTQGNAVMTGDTGEYNTKTQEAALTGNVKVIKENSTLTASEVRSYEAMRRLVASGGAVLSRPDGTAAGPRMEYFPEREYALITGGARLTGREAVITAGTVEAFFSDDRVVASANVRITSEARNLDAVADKAEYFGLGTKNGRAELTGNVRAIQDGAVLTGNHVILYMDDSAMNTDGRSKLVIQPPKSGTAPGKDNSKPVKETP